MGKILNILGGVVCGIVCIVLFTLQIVFIIITSSKSLITKNSIKGLINNVNVREIISEDPQETSNIYGLFDSLGFNVEETNEILESESLKEFLNSYINENINSFFNSEDVKLEINDIKKLISDIEEERNISFENKKDFIKLVEEKYPDIKSNMNISSSISKNLGTNTIEIVKTLTSKILTIVFITLFIIIYFIMCGFRWSMYKPLIWYGITTIMSSFLMFQMFLGISLINKFTDEKFKDAIVVALKTFKNKGMVISGIMLVIGILMVVAYYYINKKVKLNDSNNIEAKLENL